MIGNKHISDLIPDEKALKYLKINIIEANVSAGKTYFALTTLPHWAGSPSKILYLIDTANGELRIQRNIISVSRQIYSFYDYGKKTQWGERCVEAENNMPIMTYSGFGSEVRKCGNLDWLYQFDFIVCDEMQNLVNYQKYPNGTKNVVEAETALRNIIHEGNTRVIALSATPQKIREHFQNLCYDVPFDRSDLAQLETFHSEPYCGSIENILDKHKKETGILYTTEINDMKRYIDFARSIGIRANGFWSIHAKQPMERDQLILRETILEDETIPADTDLLVINAASETCIKIQGEKRKVDYMIVNDKNEEVKTQVRGRYHGDLAAFYYHDIDQVNQEICLDIPEEFVNVRLYHDEQEELCRTLKLQDPNKKKGSYYGMRKLQEYLACGGKYTIVNKKDKNRSGQHYYVISPRDTK